MRFEVFTEMIQVVVLWVVTPCDRIPTFRRTLLPPSSLHREDLKSCIVYSVYSQLPSVSVGRLPHPAT